MAAVTVVLHRLKGIKEGQQLPNSKVVILKNKVSEKVDLHTLFHKRCVIFTFPAAFSLICSKHHLPSVMKEAENFKKLQFKVICITTDKIHSLEKWNPSTENVQMASDVNLGFTTETTLLNESDPTLGPSLKRASIVVVNGIVKHLNIDNDPQVCNASSGHATFLQAAEAVKTVVTPVLAAVAAAAAGTKVRGY